ncbi:uncharacterized protein C12orf45 homolog [Megalops cyprinoides]|uniref:uncharacterized protein C12orf45 homolog n=1 Tax=Megalops cyprinoides TaxID=118141 RepID=UPI001864ED07|nr:uncharacterized protein C12orf45 homolog [Megalops cyprinoides]
MEPQTNQKRTSSRDLLSCGNGGGLHDKLLLKSKAAKTGDSLQTTKVPRSSVLDRLQCFLPQMAQANEKLTEQLKSSPAGHFDIECVSESEKVIEMDVALVELGNSDSDTEGELSDDSSSDSESEVDGEVTEENLKLPGSQRKGKPSIEVVESTDV